MSNLSTCIKLGVISKTWGYIPVIARNVQGGQSKQNQANNIVLVLHKKKMDMLRWFKNKWTSQKKRKQKGVVKSVYVQTSRTKKGSEKYTRRQVVEKISSHMGCAVSVCQNKGNKSMYKFKRHDLRVWD